MAAVYTALFVPLGVHVPYLPVWLAGHGFGPADIAVVLSAPMFLRLITTPIILAAADRASERAKVFMLLVAAALLCSLGYFLPPAYATVLIVSLLLAMPWTVQAPLADSIALSGVRRLSCSYTNMRIWGSFAYLIGNLAGGFVIGFAGFTSVPAMMSLGLLTLLAVSFVLPRVGPPRRATPTPGQIVESSWRFPRRFLFAMIGAGLIAGSHAFINSFMSIYWQRIGFGDAIIGLLWSWSVAAEVAIFLFFTRLFGHRGAMSILAMAAAAATLRWLAFPLVDMLGLGVSGYFLVQTIHAFSTGLMLIGVQKVIAEEVSESRTGAAQGLAFLFTGLATAIVTFASGPLFVSWGVSGTWPMAVISGFALLLIIAASRQPQSSGPEGQTREPS